MSHKEFPKFASEGGRARFLRAYDDALVRWPVPHQSLELQTRLGPTHVVASGTPEHPPLILLPSFAATALMWAYNARELSRTHRIYAVDVIGQPGRSIALRKVRSRDDYAGWLNDVMDELQVRRASLIGASFGAFIAANQAIATPERVGRLVLIGPAGVFTGMSLAVVLRLLTGSMRQTLRGLAGDRRAPTARVLFSPHVTPPAPDRWSSLMEVVLQERPKVTLIKPAVFSRSEVDCLRAPTLLLLGEHEQLTDPRRVIRRAKKLKPDIETEIVPAADHLVNITGGAHVTESMLAFLRADGG